MVAETQLAGDGHAVDGVELYLLSCDVALDFCGQTIVKLLKPVQPVLSREGSAFL